jgi:hypothetical protein
MMTSYFLSPNIKMQKTGAQGLLNVKASAHF